MVYWTIKDVCQGDKNPFEVLFTYFALTPSKLHEILDEVKKALQIKNEDCDLVLTFLHLFYDMKLVMFGIDEDRNLIIQFPVFVKPFAQNN